MIGESTGKPLVRVSRNFDDLAPSHVVMLEKILRNRLVRIRTWIDSRGIVSNTVIHKVEQTC